MKELIERFEKETGNEFYTINIDNGEDLYNSDFVEWMAEKLALCNVRKRYSEEDLDKAYDKGFRDGNQRDIE